MSGPFPLLERGTQIGDLVALWSEARAGKGRLVLVGGEAGAGKTALIHEFTRRHESEARLFSGGCEPVGTPLPLGPIFDIAPHLSTQFQEMLAAESAIPDIRRAFVAELDEVLGPCLLIIEDVHWADEATLDLIGYVARRLERRHVLVILTYETTSSPRSTLCGASWATS